MSSALHRLGGLCVRRRWIVLAACLAVLVAVVALAGTLGTRTTDDFSLPGTGSQKAADVLSDHFPALNDLTSPVVFESVDGKRLDDGANKRTVESVVAKLKGTDDVASVTEIGRASCRERVYDDV